MQPAAKCRDILRQARNSGSFFEKRDMMLTLRNREHEILFMDLRTWTENPVKNENKKKVLLTPVPSKYITFIDHDLDSNYSGIGYGIE
jgi:hypothetical protein